MEQIESVLRSYEVDITKLQNKLREARARQNAIAARIESAVARAKAREVMHGSRTLDAFAKFEVLERHADFAEGRAEALGMTGPKSLEEEIAELRASEKVDAELEAMYAIQAAGCAPMVRAFERGDEFAERWEGASTAATGIRVPSAVGDFLILRAVRESGGAAIAVEEDDIVKAVEDAARDDGMLLCPEGGAVLAGWRAALDRGLVSRDETAILFNCANGNKYPLANSSRRLDLASANADMLRGIKSSATSSTSLRRVDTIAPR